MNKHLKLEDLEGRYQSFCKARVDTYKIGLDNQDDVCYKESGDNDDE